MYKCEIAKRTHRAHDRLLVGEVDGHGHHLAQIARQLEVAHVHAVAAVRHNDLRAHAACKQGTRARSATLARRTGARSTEVADEVATDEARSAKHGRNDAADGRTTAGANDLQVASVPQRRSDVRHDRIALGRQRALNKSTD